MMPKLGSSTDPTKDVLGEIGKIGKFGFDFAEITIEGPEAFAWKLLPKKEKIKALLGKYKMFSVGHTMWFGDFGAPYESARKGWVEEGKKDIDLAKEIGMEFLVFHFDPSPFFFEGKRMRKVILGNYVRSMKELVSCGREKGVRLVMENCGVSNETGGVKDYKHVIDRVRGLGVHIDVGHAFVAGGMKNVLAFIRTFRGRIEHVHMHDNRGSRDDHLPLGAGSMDYQKVAGALKKSGYDKTVTFEVFAGEQHLAGFSAEKFKEAWENSY